MNPATGNSEEALPGGEAANAIGLAAPIMPVPPPMHRVFIGKDGLRAGWSLSIFIALFYVSVRAAAAALPHVPRLAAGGEVPFGPSLIRELMPLGMTILVTWIMSRIEGRPNGVYGFGDSRPATNFFLGLCWGVSCLSLLVFILWKSGLLVVERRLVFGGDVFRYGAEWLFGFFLVGMFEEYLTRGYVQYTLARGLAGIYSWVFKTRHSRALGFWTSACIFSALFGLGHGKNPGESPIGLLSAGLAGMVFCLSLWRTGSLWWAIGFHTSWDWAQSFLYGVADSGTMVEHHLIATHPAGKPVLSGGSTGPEGSIFVLAIFVVICLIILWTLPRVRHLQAANESV